MPVVLEVMIFVLGVWCVVQVLRARKWHRILDHLFLCIVVKHVLITLVLLPVLATFSEMLELGLVIDGLLGHTVHLLVIVEFVIILITIVILLVIIELFVIVQVTVHISVGHLNWFCTSRLSSSLGRPLGGRGLGWCTTSKQIFRELHVKLDIFAFEVLSCGHPELEFLVHIKVDVVVIGGHFCHKLQPGVIRDT